MLMNVVFAIYVVLFTNYKVNILTTMSAWRQAGLKYVAFDTNLS